jgi:hypothetical protein
MDPKFPVNLLDLTTPQHAMGLRDLFLAELAGSRQARVPSCASVVELISRHRSRFLGFWMPRDVLLQEEGMVRCVLAEI